jgi:L-fuconolactonase
MYKIDAHHHLWNFSEKDYNWITPQMTPLRRSFTPADLHAEMQQAGIDASIAVQARQSLEETRFLLTAAARNPFIRAVVGWVPLIDLDVEMDLERFAADPKFRAVRHVLQDEPDSRYMLRDDFNRGIRALRKFNLAYDILIFERHLPQTIEFVDKHPNQIFIVDHLAKPTALSPWRENFTELAKRPHVYCKLSGLANLEPYFQTALEAFTPKRLMFGSDWPVCLLAIPYQKWVFLVTEQIAKLTETEQTQIWSQTAQQAYQLPR